MNILISEKNASKIQDLLDQTQAGRQHSKRITAARVLEASKEVETKLENMGIKKYLRKDTIYIINNTNRKLAYYRDGFRGKLLSGSTGSTARCCRVSMKRRGKAWYLTGMEITPFNTPNEKPFFSLPFKAHEAVMRKLGYMIQAHPAVPEDYVAAELSPPDILTAVLDDVPLYMNDMRKFTVRDVARARLAKGI